MLSQARRQLEGLCSALPPRGAVLEQPWAAVFSSTASLSMKGARFTGQHSGKPTPWQGLQLAQWQGEAATAVPAARLVPSTGSQQLK